jgi:hypothetical protein
MPTTEEFWRARKDRTIPFRLRAGIINAYRRERLHANGKTVNKDFFSPKEKVAAQRFSEEDKLFKARRNRQNRLPKRLLPQPKRSRNSAKNNFVSVNSLFVTFKLTSKGKGRPTRKKKIKFKAGRRVIHLRGNRYNGGYEWPMSR